MIYTEQEVQELKVLLESASNRVQMLEEEVQGLETVQHGLHVTIERFRAKNKDLLDKVIRLEPCLSS